MAAEPQACHSQGRAFESTPLPPGEGQGTLADALGWTRVQGCLLGPKLCHVLGEGGKILGGDPGGKGSTLTEVQA